MNVRELEKIIMADGWYIADQVGSHRQYKHPLKKGKVTIPIHRGDVSIKTANAVLKQAGIKR